MSNDIVSTKVYDKREDLDFEIVNFPSLDAGVPRSASCDSQLIRFAGASVHVAGFSAQGGLLTRRLLEQGCH